MPSFSKIIAILAASSIAVMALPQPQLDGLTSSLPLVGGATGTDPANAVTSDIPSTDDATGDDDAAGDDLEGDYPAADSKETSNNAELSSEMTGTGNGMTCSKGTKIACCDTTGGNGLGGNILGGSCIIPNLAILAVTTGNQCPTGNAFCCPTTQTGDLDISASCLPITA